VKRFLTMIDSRLMKDSTLLLLREFDSNIQWRRTWSKGRKYDLLRGAGFSPAEASKMRHWSFVKVWQEINRRGWI
jgi:hypothetical protein